MTVSSDDRPSNLDGGGDFALRANAGVGPLISWPVVLGVLGMSLAGCSTTEGNEQ